MSRLLRRLVRLPLLTLAEAPMGSRTVRHAALVVVASVLGVGLWALAGQRTAAQIDLSGSWSASYSLECAATFDQAGSDLSALIGCGGEVAGTLTGTVDPTTGEFALMGLFGVLPIEIEGTASADGNSMSGTWSAPPFVQSGTLSGTREGAAPDSTDLTGDWIITVAEVFAGSCDGVIEHSGADLSTTLNCEGQLGTFEGTFEGTFDPATGGVFLSGLFGTFGQLDMEGTVSADGSSLSGTWMIVPAGPSGTFIATRLEGPTPSPTVATRGTPAATSAPGSALEPTETATAVPAALPATGGGAGRSSSAGAPDWLIVAFAGAVALGGAAWYARGRSKH